MREPGRGRAREDAIRTVASVISNNERGYDVVVVGARAAGAATAMLLARAGCRVLVVDRSSYGADTISTHGLMRAGVLQLQRWGLLDRVVAAGTPPIRRTTFSYGGECGVVITIKPSFGVDALYAPRRTVLDPIIVDAAVAAGADIRYGITVTDVIRDGGGRVTGIVGHDVDGCSVAFSAGTVVGADGLRSTIARSVDAPFERVGTGATGVVYGYWSEVETDGYEWVYTPGAVAGLIPTNDGQACIFAGGSPARIGPGGIAVLRALLGQASPALASRVAGAIPPQAVRRFTGPPGFLRRCWGPGWALVGDAGYWKDPIGVHGITDALRDAELLARALIAADGGGQDRTDALAGYQATRDRLSVDLFDTVDLIARHDWNEEEVSELLLRMSSAMAEEVEMLASLDAARVS
jgi:flavin-dependent dehydrogenase